jgi:hypothetical protein
VRDYGIEQTVRDSRIAMVYEGTNEIQAVDLVQRKLLDDVARADPVGRTGARTRCVARNRSWRPCGGAGR